MYDLRWFTYQNKQNSKTTKQSNSPVVCWGEKGKSGNIPGVSPCPNFASVLKEQYLRIEISHFWVKLWYCILLYFEPLRLEFLPSFMWFYYVLEPCLGRLACRVCHSLLCFSFLRLFLCLRALQSRNYKLGNRELGPGFLADSFRRTALQPE